MGRLLMKWWEDGVGSFLVILSAEKWGRCVRTEEECVAFVCDRSAYIKSI